MVTEPIHWMYAVTDYLLRRFQIYHFKTKTFANNHYKLQKSYSSTLVHPLVRTTSDEYTQNYNHDYKVIHSYPEGEITKASRKVKKHTKDTEYMWYYEDKSGNVYSLGYNSKVVDGERGDIGFTKTIKDANEIKKTYLEMVRLKIIKGPKIPFKLIRLND